MSTPTSAEIYKAACDCWAKLDKSGMAYEFSPQSICIASFKDGAEFAITDLRAENERLRETEKDYCASVKCRDDDILALRARLAELEACKHSVTVACTTFPNVAEYVAQLERERDEEQKRAIAARADAINAQRERDEARRDSARLEKVKRLLSTGGIKYIGLVSTADGSDPHLFALSSPDGKDARYGTFLKVIDAACAGGAT